MQRIQKKFGYRASKTSRGKEIHVSDLTGCLMKPYCRVTGVERKQSKSSIGLMVFGIIAQKLLQWTYPKRVCEFEANIALLKDIENIFGHIDIYEKEIYPIEVKASRKRVFKSSQIPIAWVEQLMSYMSMTGAHLGWIVLFNVFSVQIMAFKFVLSKKDILGWLVTLSKRASSIITATKTKDCSELEICPEEYEWCGYKHGCPRAEECRQKWKEWKKSREEERKKKKSANS